MQEGEDESSVIEIYQEGVTWIEGEVIQPMLPPDMHEMSIVASVPGDLLEALSPFEPYASNVELEPVMCITVRWKRRVRVRL